MDIPLNPFVNFLLIIGGYLLSVLLGLVVYFLKRRNEFIDKELERLDSREQSRWVAYTDKHAVLSGKVDILQDNYKTTIENIREDLREVKAHANFIPVLKNEMDNLKRLLEDGFGTRARGH